MMGWRAIDLTIQAVTAPAAEQPSNRATEQPSNRATEQHVGAAHHVGERARGGFLHVAQLQLIDLVFAAVVHQAL